MKGETQRVSQQKGEKTMELQNQNIFCSNEIFAAVLDACDVTGYQLAILTGAQRLSGSDLKGAAKRWSSNYMRRVVALKKLVESHGFAVERTTYREIGYNSNQIVWVVTKKA